MSSEATLNEIKEKLVYLRDIREGLRSLPSLNDGIQGLHELLYGHAKRLDSLEWWTAHLENKIEILDRTARNKNLILFNLDEDYHEPYVKLLQIVLDFFSKRLNLNITYNDIENVKRLGAKGSPTRPICVTFCRVSSKIDVLYCAKKLKGTNFGISRDMTTKERAERRALIPRLRYAKQQGLNAFLRGNRLYINNIAVNQMETGATAHRKSRVSPSNARPKNSSAPSLPKGSSSVPEHRTKSKNQRLRQKNPLNHATNVLRQGSNELYLQQWNPSILPQKKIVDLRD